MKTYIVLLTYRNSRDGHEWVAFRTFTTKKAVAEFLDAVREAEKGSSEKLDGYFVFKAKQVSQDELDRY